MVFIPLTCSEARSSGVFSLTNNLDVGVRALILCKSNIDRQEGEYSE